ncbi:hypothetical protein D6829_02335 [Candidatus Pacearchaeota archaeon]|nr:MAG: hypothetical protein D6829_02335 [Candidatus Pacearchaeota archaeon]
MGGVESFYKGGYSSFEPEGYGNFTGFKMTPKQFSKLGFPGHPARANQAAELASAARAGAKTFEVTFLSDETAQTAPVQMLKEIRALAKLTGIKPTFHGPLVDPAGFSQQGWTGEEGRAEAERKVVDALEKAHMIKPEGNIPVVFHAANGMPGVTYRPGEGEERFVEKRVPVVNADTGQVVTFVEEKEEFSPERVAKGKTKVSVDERIKEYNKIAWENNLNEVHNIHLRALEELSYGVRGNLPKVIESLSKEDVKEVDEIFGEKGGVSEVHLKHAGRLNKHSRELFRSTFEVAYRHSNPEQKKKLRNLALEWSKEKEKLEKEIGSSKNEYKKIFLDIGLQDKYLNKFFEITGGDSSGSKPPEIFQNVEKFAMDKAAETFGNAAAKAYKKFGKTMPIIAIENVWQELGFSRAEDMEALVKKSRKKFAESLVGQGMDKKRAEEIAEKHIGVNWDMGHLNIMRRHGFSKEDMIKETKKIAKYVKHLHITDNFGFSDSHLAPGMGNVPIKEILKELEKAGRLDEIHKIVEAGGIMGQFQKVPHHQLSLSAFGSPLYGMKAAPLWDNIGSYFSGYGETNPSVHHSMYGAGFSMLPAELGGQIGGERSRFSGTNMA